ncbi:MAG: hypothetical protein M3T56_05990 [Chloroflexota bacterium]|nr:hypothetical protein [Chloroflexota bacterium]
MTASAASTVPAADRYGYVFIAERGRIIVRRERNAAPIFELAGVAPAVSADGKRIAYWRATPNVGNFTDFTPGGTDLRILDVADPTSDRSVLAMSGQTLGGNVVWSNDGQGLLVATYSRETVGPTGLPAQYDLLMLDLASTPPSTRSAAAQVSGGLVYRPIAWDRPGQVAAAVVVGSGGGFAVEYVTWDGNAASPFARVPLRGMAVSSASADAKLVLGGVDDKSGSVQQMWPLNDITKAETLRSPGPNWVPSFWRPGPTAPHELIWTVGLQADQVRSLELVPNGTVSSTTLYTAAGGEQRMAFVAVRPDGSGVLVSEETPRPTADPPTPTTRLVVVDVATRQATDIWTTTGYVRFLPRGVLLR